ncbi:hypothetical protein Cylst_2523 [Cylindrospermum stagnale PCC 7417]|uniref:HEAT repeat domain-containing protein n=1 Tax=Cylindrospermum stagnale PCC 7417 TaxID=56107 RepID=K9WYZ5_9NOST|nr:hypothetical protein [Cylindrospermum stagnale]AFZ24732.1 hypothetical protein Cylst_2523 [Cylindrospermum stagnale PCC 7417]
MNSEVITETINKAIASSDAKLLRECFFSIKSTLSDVEIFAEYFDFLSGLLNQDKFLELGGGWYFLMLLGTVMFNLSTSEKQSLLPSLQLAHEAFDNINPQIIEEAIEQAMAVGEEMQMEECADAISGNMSMKNYFPEYFFDLIIDLLKQQKFLVSQGSSHFLTVLEFNFRLLSDVQKDSLLPLLETAYPSFTDWMSWFVISELLGQYFADERAFEILCRLKNVAAEQPRSLVPHGFEHIVRDSGNEALAKKAYAELLEMKSDVSPQVRDEVETSLKQIDNK